VIGIHNFRLDLTRCAVAAAALLAVALLLPAGAAAQTPTQDQYAPIFHHGGGGSTAGSLPFTGLDLAALVVAGVCLLAAGLALERFRRRHPASSQ
jgi:hypothetical protein